LDIKGYYAILGVSEKASYQEIKRSYRQMARKYHPDRNNSSFAEDMIKKINAAFEVLSDKDKRLEYDTSGYSIGLFNAASSQSTYSSSSDPQSGSDTSANGSNSDDVNYSQYDFNFYSKQPKKDHHEGISSNNIELPKGRFHIIVEPSLCMAFGSCETLAPKVFVVEKNKRINPKARVESETGADLDTILASAQTCPTKAIRIIDRYTWEQIYP
jgi:molecular chaperone DnaJ